MKNAFKVILTIGVFVVVSLVGIFISVILFPGNDTPAWYMLFTFIAAAAIAFLVFAKTSRKKQTRIQSSSGRHAQPAPAANRPAPRRSSASAETYQSAERRVQADARRAREIKYFSDTLASIPAVKVSISKPRAKRRPLSDMPEIKFLNITRRTPIEKLFPLVVIDTETTGISLRGNDIIEVSAIKYDVGFSPVSCYSTLLRPRSPIPEAASMVNHITDDMVADKPFFGDIAESFSAYISGCNIVGHNLLFDLRFLHICGATLPESARYYDTLRLAKYTLTSQNSTKWDHDTDSLVDVDDYDVEDYKLDTLCEHYGIYRDTAHRSLSDCLATAMLFEHLIEDKTS